MLRHVTAQLVSLSPYSQSRHVGDLPKLDKELDMDYERRMWRHRTHSLPDGRLFIPPMAFKNCLAEAAKFLSLQIPGKGKQTWTKHFEAGVLVTDGIVLPVTRDDVEGEWLFLNADGKRGSGRRVERCYPVIREWSGNVDFHVIDDMITKDAFEHHLHEAGTLIGIGRFRPRNNGYYGRFRVEKYVWH